MNGSFLTNCQEPNIRDQQVSVSPGLKFGCISVKKIYWGMVDGEVQGSSDQLIWREFFYTMSANNPFYGEMKRNPICINIPWQGSSILKLILRYIHNVWLSDIFSVYTTFHKFCCSWETNNDHFSALPSFYIQLLKHYITSRGLSSAYSSLELAQYLEI